MPRSKNQKRQTKLAFSPIAADTKHAHVLYDGSPAKRRRVEDYVQAQSILTSDGPSSSALKATLTSPPRSSQAVTRNRMPLTPQFGSDTHQHSSHKHELTPSGDDTSSDSQAGNALRNTKVKSKGRIKESNKIFSQPTQSSPLNGRRSGADNRAASESSDDILSSSSSSSDTDEPALPSKSSSGKTRGNLSRPRIVELISSDDQHGESDDDDDDDIIAPSSIQRRSARKSQETIMGEGSEDSGEVRPAPSQRRSLRTSQKSLDREDSEEIRPASTQRASLRRSKKQLEPEQDEAAQPMSSHRRSKRNAKRSPDLEDSDDVLPSSSRGRRLARRSDVSPSERSRHTVDHDDEGEDGNVQSIRAKKSREKDEINEEAEDLNEESTVFRDDGPSSSRPSKRDDRRRRLEQLKAKRNVRASSPVAVEDEDPEEEEEESEVSEEDGYERADWNEEDEEDDFVIEDDGEMAAVPDDEDEIPEEMMALEFMRHANRSLKEHWFYVVEWLLQNRLNPGGSSAVEGLYRKSVDKVNDKCAANIARLVSSSWSSTFIRTLKARPDYNEAPWEGSGFLETTKCSACNRTGHVPRFQVTFTGKAYDKETLEPLKDEDDEDGDSVDEDGFQITDENRDFKLGTFCRSNAINAHALVHWRMGLKDWISAYLKGKGYLKSKRIVERAEWSQIKKSKLVESIMDDLRASGEIKRLWREFEQTVEAVPDVKGQNYRR